MKKTITAIIAGVLTGGLLLVIIPYLLTELNTLLALAQRTSVSSNIIGLSLILLAVIYWWYCTYQLSSWGKGTPAPIAPTKELVIKSPYNNSRNPMYLCYQAILWGIAILCGHLLLFMYAIIMSMFIHWYVRYVEEPNMRKKFGQEYVNYCSQVQRWIRIKKNC